MDSEHILKLIDAMKLLAETLGGLRKQLIDNGFTEETAEVLVVMAAEKMMDIEHE